MQMSKKILLCSWCGWKRISDLTDPDLKELKNDTMSSRKFRCLKCGRGIAPRPIKDPQKELELKNKETNIKEENKKWIDEVLQFQDDFRKEKQIDE